MKLGLKSTLNPEVLIESAQRLSTRELTPVVFQAAVKLVEYVSAKCGGILTLARSGPISQKSPALISGDNYLKSSSYRCGSMARCFLRGFPKFAFGAIEIWAGRCYLYCLKPIPLHPLVMLDSK